LHPMSRIFVAGLINIETTLKIDAFPIPYFPVRYPFFGVNSTVSGVGYNVSKALTVLGDEVCFASLIGKDLASESVYQALQHDGISSDLVLNQLDRTAQSVILYDPEGKRQIHTDLKDIQDRTFPLQLAAPILQTSDLAVLCDINFARPLLNTASDLGIPIATDAHTIASLDDPYHQDFFRSASIIFMSDENLPESPQSFAQNMIKRFDTQIVVVGLGKQGALLARKDTPDLVHVPAVYTRPVVNTIGAGDALFSCFVHQYARHADPLKALQAAVVFASYKIGAVGAAEGFLDQSGLNQWCHQVSVKQRII